MPMFKESSSSGSSDGELSYRLAGDAQHIVSDDEYAGASLPGYSELPLSEQLEPIAVVGMGCHLPGDVKSPSDLFELLSSKGTGQTPKVPSSRFNIDAHFHENNERPGSFGVLGGYFLNETLQEFDPSFFGITPVEAMWMDPQQRKLLEVVYECFESAGLTLDDLSGSDTACYMASFTADFQQMSFKEPSFRHSLAATGVDPGIISNRISHVFNLKGPSIVVNTACSSSVYAIHNACNALRTKECSAAVVGGVNLVLTVDQHMNTAKLGVLSPSSTCHTFNSYANGYGRAEGVGAVYLKRLNDAIRDGDPIRGVIRSSATNNNGKVPAVGITHPSFAGQRSVIKHAYQRGGSLDPRLTGYFECHGTGTAIGDPLEVHAVADSMNESRDEADGPLLIGAVKTNIGHSEAASGLSAIIKAVLIVERGIIPPTRGVTDPNPAIDWKKWKVEVATESTSFPVHLPVKRVSVNSFGYGGTNAHIIVESADSLLVLPQTYKHASMQKKTRMQPVRGAFNRKRPYLLLFSAHDKPTLKRNIEAIGAVACNYNLLDLSYTLANRRTQFSSRGMVVSSLDGFEEAFSENFKNFSFADKKKTKEIGFIFTGQGAQWARMGADLMLYYPSFLRSIKRLDAVLEDLEEPPDWTLEDLLLDDARVSRVNEAEFSQPLCTAIQIALVQLLQLWEVRPSVTCGHSSGEIAAAYAAGFISASEAIVLAYYRGLVVRDINTNGAMLAVGLGAEAVSPYIEHTHGNVVVACHNSPSGVTLSGNLEELESIHKSLTAENIFARLLKTNGKAYHSPHMQPAAEKYEGLVRRAKSGLVSEFRLFEKAKMVSSVTNSILSENTVLDEAYWSSNLLNPVLFSQAVRTIGTSPEFATVDVLIEVGPHSVLAGPFRQIKAEFDLDKLQYLPTLVRQESCASSMLKLAGELFLRDYPVNLQRVTASERLYPSGKIQPKNGSLIVDLPPYQWDKNKKLWAESRESREHRAPKFPRHDILGSLLIGASLAEPTWRNILRIKDLPWLNDHSLGGEAVFPAAGYFSMAMEAITQLYEVQEVPIAIEGYVFRDVAIQQALVTPDDDDGIEVLLNMRPSLHSTSEGQNPWWDFSVSSISSEGYRKDHMAGSISVSSDRQCPAVKEIPHLPQRASGKAWNQALKEVGFNYGPSFQDMDDITFDGRTYVACSSTRIKTKVEGMNGESRHIIHPASVDSCLQLMIVAIWAGRTNAMDFGAVPVGAEEITIWKPTTAQVADGRAQAFSWIDPRGSHTFNCHNQLVAGSEVLMEIKNMRCTAYEAAKPQQAISATKPQPYSQMVWKQDVDFLSREELLDVPSFIELANFKNPANKVLMIGSTYVEQTLEKVPNLQLTATESSSELVDLLTQKVSSYKNVKVRELDLARGLESQSIKKGSQDVVVASIYTPEELLSVREALSVGGRAILIPTIPLIPDALVQAGFSGIDLTLTAAKYENVVVATASSPTSNGAMKSPRLREIHLIYRQEVPAILDEVKKVLTDMDYDVTSSGLTQPGPTGPNIIFLADFATPLLPTITEQEFQGMQEIIACARTVLWATAGGLLTGKNPEYAMASGMKRSLTSEMASLSMITMDFDTNNTSATEIGRILAHTAVQQMQKGASLENEYLISEGKFFISRLLPADIVNDAYFLNGREVETSLFDPEQHLVGKLLAGKVVFETDNRLESVLDPVMVEVQVLASGMNREDVSIISGKDLPTDFSHEIGGIVKRVGTAVKDFNIGDRIVGFSFDKYATFQRVHQDLLQKVGPSESLTEMTSLPMIYGAALHGLKVLANLQRGESVLVLPGSGLVGAAALKVAQALGGFPYLVVNDETQRAQARQHFGLDAKQVLVGSKASRLENAKGYYEADVIFAAGLVDASTAREAWRHISPFGRFVDCGRKDTSRGVLDTVPIQRGASYFSFNLLDLYKWKPKALSNLLALAVDLYRQDATIVPKIRVTDFTNLNDCVASFTDDFEDGKVILTHERSQGMVSILPTRPRLKLNSDATYLLVGCLGGLGRSLTSWMMSKGARNFAFLSRSGADSKQASILVEDLKASGAVVQIIRGDAGDKGDVDRAIESIPAERPLRGVIQAAMVLRDGMLHNMSFENWKISTHPKVNGTKNLHEATQGLALDFFVMTSSVSGTLGTPGQSNYAAGNAYLDSLARHRRTRQQNAAAIILPMVLGIGVVAENLELEDSLKRKGMYGIDEEALLDAFEVAILEQQSPRALDHLVVGLDPLLLQKARKEAGEGVDDFWAQDSRFKTLLHAAESASESASNNGSQTILSVIKSGIPAADAVRVVSEHFVTKLARVLMISIDDIGEDNRSIASYGVDSMTGVELRNWIFKELGLDIAFQQLLGPSLTITKFSELVCLNQGIKMDQEEVS